MSSYVERVANRQRVISGRDWSWTAAEQAAWPMFSPYVTLGSALWLGVDAMPSTAYNAAARPALYTDHPGDDAAYTWNRAAMLPYLALQQQSLGGLPTNKEDGFYLVERVARRIFAPALLNYHPSIVLDDSTGKPCLSFGAPPIVGNELTQPHNGAIRPFPRINAAGAERNNYALFSADQAYSLAVKFRVPAVDSVVNDIDWTGISVGGDFLGGQSSTPDNNPEFFVHLGSGAFTMRNRIGKTGYVGGANLRDSTVHTVIAGYDPVANTYKVSMDGGAFDTQGGSGDATFGIIGTDPLALLPAAAGAGSNVAALNNRYCGFLMFLAWIPSTLWLTDATARGKMMTLMAEK